MALQRPGFEVELRPVASLRPHEDVIPSHVEELAEDCLRDGVQKDPVLIDGRTGSVLDGMHRIAAFRRLGLERAVCCSFDYASDSIVLKRWARVYSGPGRDELMRAVAEAGVDSKTTAGAALGELERKGAGVAAISGEGAQVPAGRPGLGWAFSVVRRLDGECEAKGWTRRFVHEADLQEELGAGEVALLVERLSKGDVLSAAAGGSPFPCKTSMHLVDPRPVRVNFPIKELNGRTDEPLRRLLSAEARILPPGSVYEGRRYKERLALLNPA